MPSHALDLAAVVALDDASTRALRALLELDPSERVRETALRLAVQSWPHDDRPGLAACVSAVLDDSSDHVRLAALQLVHDLGLSVGVDRLAPLRSKPSRCVTSSPPHGRSRRSVRFGRRTPTSPCRAASDGSSSAMFATLALVATLFVAVLHVLFMVLETFLWTTPRGRKIFGQTKEGAEQTKVLAANQGVYNGALAALIAWAALTGETHATMAGLVFVIVVGLYGAATAKGTILFIQALPAAVALALWFLA